MELMKKNHSEKSYASFFKAQDFLQIAREIGKSTKWQQIKVTKSSHHSYDDILILSFCCGDHCRFFLNKKF